MPSVVPFRVCPCRNRQAASRRANGHELRRKQAVLARFLGEKWRRMAILG